MISNCTLYQNLNLYIAMNYLLMLNQIIFKRLQKTRKIHRQFKELWCSNGVIGKWANDQSNWVIVGPRFSEVSRS
jgi:hypothetical protein